VAVSLDSSFRRGNQGGHRLTGKMGNVPGGRRTVVDAAVETAGDGETRERISSPLLIWKNSTRQVHNLNKLYT